MKEEETKNNDVPYSQVKEVKSFSVLTSEMKGSIFADAKEAVGLAC